MSRKSLEGQQSWPSFRRLRRRLRIGAGSLLGGFAADCVGALPLQTIKKVKKKFEFYGITLVSSSHRRFK